MTKSGLKHAAAAAPGIVVSLLPKLMCPACWPAYAGLLSAVGLGFLISAKYLLVLTVAFLAITSAGIPGLPPSRVRPVLSGTSRRGGDFERQVLFRC